MIETGNKKCIHKKEIGRVWGDAREFYFVNINHEVPTVYLAGETTCICVGAVEYI